MPPKELKDKPAPVPKQTKPKAKAKEKKEAKQTKQLKAAEKGKPTSITRFTTLFKFLSIVFLSALAGLWSLLTVFYFSRTQSREPSTVKGIKRVEKTR